MLRIILEVLIILVFIIVIIKKELKIKSISREVDTSFNDFKESKNSLNLILNSTAEAIYGLDKEGKCTFCNESGLRMLGYDHQDELLGKNMHDQIHHSYKDGRPMDMNECKIVQSLKMKEGSYVRDEVFWRKDGTYFHVEYRSYPQIRDEESIGVVVTFMDITERKKAEEELRYLSYHDSLTGLYNRMYFEEELKRLDTNRNLPISIIHGDANGLKLTNDIFGHTAGDNLLKNIADVIRNVCRADDIIARIGGDEFVILLPNTESIEADKIIKRIKKELSKVQTTSIKADISMGSSTKTSPEQSMLSVIEDAENKMYQMKALDRKKYNSGQMINIVNSLHEKYPREKIHSRNVSELSERIGVALNLSQEDVRRLKDAGYYHDIGKVVLEKGDPVEYKQHSIIGYRILNSFDDTLDLAEAVLSHHELWDGSGFPRGLRGEEIPKLARILSIAEQYDSLTNEMNDKVMNSEDAVEEIKKKSGIKFDPKIVEVFVKLMKSSFQ